MPNLTRGWIQWTCPDCEALVYAPAAAIDARAAEHAEEHAAAPAPDDTED